MKTSLIKFKEEIKSLNYIFHFHTNYTDGLCDVFSYFEYANKNKINLLIFTEHVRQSLNYNFDSFIQDINYGEKKFPNIHTLIGCEAKILPGGSLDIPLNIISKIDLICFACHSFPSNLELYKSSLEYLFKSNEWSNFLRVWVHPGRFLKKLNIIDKNLNILKELINIAVSNDIFIELNLKEKLPPYCLIESIEPSKLITGYDAHSIEDIDKIKNTNYFNNL